MRELVPYDPRVRAMATAMLARWVVESFSRAHV
jgi:hypothetical protein